MRIMVLGDIFGQPGMKAVVNKLPKIIKKKDKKIILKLKNHFLNL